MKSPKSVKAISPLIATVMLLGLTLVAGLLVIGMSMDWFRGASFIESIDASKTLVYMDQSTGKGKMIVVLKNTGTSSLRLRKIALHCKIDPAVITFEGTGDTPIKVTNGTVDLTGTLLGSSASVAVITVGTTKLLHIPPGQTATLELTFDGTVSKKMTDLFNIGSSYRATIYSGAGAGGIYSFVFNIEFG